MGGQHCQRNEYHPIVDSRHATPTKTKQGGGTCREDHPVLLPPQHPAPADQYEKPERVTKRDNSVSRTSCDHLDTDVLYASSEMGTGLVPVGWPTYRCRPDRFETADEVHGAGQEKHDAHEQDRPQMPLRRTAAMMEHKRKKEKVRITPWKDLLQLLAK